MRTRGSLFGPCTILDVLLSPRQPKDIDPHQYGFRMFATLKTPDKRYAEIVNCGLWVASGVWHPNELIIERVSTRRRRGHFRRARRLTANSAYRVT